MTKLKRYATTRPGAIRALATAAKVTEGQMSRIVHGERGASLGVALAIQTATGGAITTADVAAAKVNTKKEKKSGPARIARGRT